MSDARVTVYGLDESGLICRGLTGEDRIAHLLGVIVVPRRVKTLERVLRHVFLRHFESMTVSQVREHATAQGITPGQLMRQIDSFAAFNTSAGSSSSTAQISRR